MGGTIRKAAYSLQDPSRNYVSNKGESKAQQMVQKGSTFLEVRKGRNSTILNRELNEAKKS